MSFARKFCSKSPFKMAEGDPYKEAKELGVKTDDLQSMPRSTADIVYTARMRAARERNKNQ